MTRTAPFAALALVASLCAACADRAPSAPAPSATGTVNAASAAGGDIYAFSAVPLGGGAPIPLAKYKGQVLLIANVAAHCGYTPQYRPLGEVERRYADRGLRVLGFVSDEFGKQAGTVDEIKTCSADASATFQQFAEIRVKKGPEQHPLFAWLTSQPGMADDVSWNFNKWLVGKKGELLARWPSKVEPDAPEVIAAIEKALAQ
jgi:glutathione peroxidase